MTKPQHPHSGISWIKLMTHTFDDDKIKIIENMPEGKTILLFWLKLLTQAGKTNDGGRVYFRRGIPYTPEMFSTLYGYPVNIIILALRTFVAFEMIEMIAPNDSVLDNNFVATDGRMIYISNWNKYQNVEGMDKVREQTRQRTAQYRDRLKLAASTFSDSSDSGDATGDVTSNVTVTQSDAPRIRSKNLEKDLKPYAHPTAKRSQSATRCGEFFDRFWNLYPRKLGRSKALTKWEMYYKRGEIDIDKVIAGTEAYIRYIDWQRQTRKEFAENFVQHGVTFVNGKGWEDDWTIPVAPSSRRNDVVTADDPDPYGITEHLRKVNDSYRANN